MESNLIINIISAISIVVALYAIIGIIRLNRANRREKERISNAISNDRDEYARIVFNTRHIVNQRQPNCGVHYDDESTYINRARIIKDKTSFFKFVNS